MTTISTMCHVKGFWFQFSNMKRLLLAFVLLCFVLNSAVAQLKSYLVWKIDLQVGFSKKIQYKRKVEKMLMLFCFLMDLVVFRKQNSSLSKILLTRWWIMLPFFGKINSSLGLLFFQVMYTKTFSNQKKWISKYKRKCGNGWSVRNLFHSVFFLKKKQKNHQIRIASTQKKFKYRKGTEECIWGAKVNCSYHCKVGFVVNRWRFLWFNRWSFGIVWGIQP